MHELSFEITEKIIFRNPSFFLNPLKNGCYNLPLETSSKLSYFYDIYKYDQFRENPSPPQHCPSRKINNRSIFLKKNSFLYFP